MGAGKITAILQNQGVKTSKKYVSQLMKELGISSVSTTARKEYKNWEKDRTEISCSSSSKPNGRIKSRSAILLLLGLMISIIICVRSLTYFQERLFSIESLRIAVHNYSLKHLSKPIPRENRKRDLCFTVTGEHNIFLTHLSIY